MKIKYALAAFGALLLAVLSPIVGHAGPVSPPINAQNISINGGSLKAYYAFLRQRNVINASTKFPLIQAPLWQASTAYAVGDYVRSSTTGDLEIAVVAGTSGATEPTWTSANAITDNTAKWWSPGRRARVNADGYPVPTITVGTSITGLSVTPFYSNQSLWTAQSCPNLVNGAGGNSTQQWAFNDGGTTSTQGIGVGLRGYLCTKEFTTDAPKLAIGIWNSLGVSVRIYADGYLIEENPTKFTSGNPSYYTIDWGANGRKVRAYRIEQAGSINITGVAVDAASKVTAAPTAGVKCVWISDSYGGTVSSYTLPAWEYLSERIMRSIGCNWTRNLHIGGTGYINTSGGLYYNALQDVTNNPPVNWDAQIVVVGHSFNDYAVSTPSAIAAQALSTWQTLRTQYPNAMIVVLGPWPSRNYNDSTKIAADSALSSQLTSWGDPNAAFISFVNNASGSPIFGTGYVGSTTGTGNSDFDTGSDGTHPTVTGKETLENWLVPRIDAQLLLHGY